MTLLGNVFENNLADDDGGATIWLNKPFIETFDSNEQEGGDTENDDVEPNPDSGSGDSTAD